MPTTERRPDEDDRAPRVAIVLVVVVLAAVVLGGWWGLTRARDWVTGFGSSVCQARAGSYEGSLDAEAMNNAALITAVSVKRGLPPRAATIALATAMQESKLHNIAHGDRDSMGLFQQRPSQGWGSVDEIMDPMHATNAFYDALVKVKGWQTGEITKVAQSVQRSGFPEAYAAHEPEARAIASALTGQTHAGLGCRIDALTADDHRSGGAAIGADLTSELGIAAAHLTADGTRLQVRADSPTQAWSVGQWAVAKAAEHGIASVTVGDQAWTRSKDTAAWTWHRAEHPTDATTVVIA